jgi:hypothetical protein
MELKGVDITFNADGWPAKKIAMFASAFGMPPMDQGPKWRRLLPITRLRVWWFYFINGLICKKHGHIYTTEAAKQFHLCSRCVTFQKDPDELPRNKIL